MMALCDAQKCELFERNRKMMNPDGLNSLHSLLVVDQHREILRLALNFQCVEQECGVQGLLRAWRL